MFEEQKEEKYGCSVVNDWYKMVLERQVGHAGHGNQAKDLDFILSEMYVL